MNQFKKIFLDLDGVIVDFVQGVLDWYELGYTQKDVTSWDSIVTLSGMKENEFWEGLSNADFWENLRTYNWSKAVLKTVEKAGLDVCLLTSPAWGTAGFKQNWIQKNMPEYFNSKRYLIGPAKSFCANSDSVLVDDSEANCIDFVNAGGTAVLFPQPWNANSYVDTQFKVDWLWSEFVIKGLTR